MTIFCSNHCSYPANYSWSDSSGFATLILKLLDAYVKKCCVSYSWSLKEIYAEGTGTVLFLTSYMIYDTVYGSDGTSTAEIGNGMKDERLEWRSPPPPWDSTLLPVHNDPVAQDHCGRYPIRTRDLCNFSDQLFVFLPIVPGGRWLPPRTRGKALSTPTSTSTIWRPSGLLTFWIRTPPAVFLYRIRVIWDLGVLNPDPEGKKA